MTPSFQKIKENASTLSHKVGRLFSPDRIVRSMTSFTGMPVRRNRSDVNKPGMSPVRRRDARRRRGEPLRAGHSSSITGVDRQTEESRYVFTDQQVGLVVAGQLRKCTRCAHMNSLQPGAHSGQTAVRLPAQDSCRRCVCGLEAHGRSDHAMSSNPQLSQSG